MTTVNKIFVDLPQIPKNAVNTPAAGNKDKPFADVLKSELNRNSQIQFSEHAKARLRDRHIELTDQDRVKIDRAVENAASKGAKDSLVLLNDLALLVSVKNRTVITALDQQAQTEKVFTNIDSAVIIR